MDRNDPIPRDHDPPELKLTGPVDERWIRAHRAFIALKTKVATTPILRHFDEARTTRDPGPNEAFYVGMAVQVDGIAGSPRTMVRPPGPVDARDHEVHERQGRNIGAIAASITPRAKIDDALTEIAPRKEPKRQIQAPIPTVDRDEELWVVSFDDPLELSRGRVEPARMGGGQGQIGLSREPHQYIGQTLGRDVLENLDRKHLEVCGDSNLVIRQIRGEIDCKAPGLTLLKRKALDRLRKWNAHELVHVKKDCNGSADSLASAALQRQGGIEVQEMTGYQDLVTLNRLDKILIPKTENLWYELQR
ncbi:reverse transcriptase [Phytophthora megakarya]|uniref:Reverse transcriptase n=1 Tax=Phytophthora megakarya TaxID=4795 RepID=A0A225W1R8_9STRA|nr:reverse transcriptase [Phytophthora megakarya]